MNESNCITCFTFESSDVRVVTDQMGEPWFVLRDVLQAMDRKGVRTNEAKSSIDEGLGDGYVKTVPILDSMGRTQQATIISEPAVTFLVSRSNTETGRKLNRWIHAEVLPSIRKTGGYGNSIKTRADYLLEAAIRFKEQENAILALEQQQSETERRINELVGGDDYVTIKGFARTHKKPADRETLKTIGKRAAAICRMENIGIGKVRDENWGEVNSYPREIVARSFDSLDI